MSVSGESLKETGKAAAAALVEMVMALECDYDRLEELRDTLKDCDVDLANGNCGYETAEMDAMRVELAELIDAAGECKSREDAETRIQEDALSVEVRTDWYTLDEEKPAPSEFKILLSTGGPASRIVGELDEHGQPDRAWLEVQDWGTPWTRHFDIEQDTLLAYARCFYFGEGS